MGLLDSVLGGVPDRSGLSAATKALLLVLAAKAAKDFMAHHQTSAQTGGAAPGAGPGGGGLGGMLGSVLGGGQAGGLGSTLGGAGGRGLGGLLNGLGGAGALGALVDQFGKGGQGPAMHSWIGPSPNQPIAPDQLGEILGPGPLQELQARTGLSRSALLEQLAHELPTAVDHITPAGRLPTDAELVGGAQADAQPKRA